MIFFILLLSTLTSAKRLTESYFRETFLATATAERFLLEQLYRDAVDMRMNVLTLAYNIDPVKWQPCIDNLAIITYLTNINFDQIQSRTTEEFRKEKFNFTHRPIVGETLLSELRNEIYKLQGE